MGSVKSGLLSAAAASLVAAMAIVGCSADGEAGGIQAPAQDNNAVLPPGSSSSGGDPDPAPDSGKKPPKSDAGVDSGPPAPAEGDPCTTVDQIFKRQCGKCGKQEAICQSGDGGGLKVSAYGPCGNEIGLCTPGETQACGNCGTQTCSNSCNFTACTGQPANSCAPGSVEYTNAGCDPLTYKNKTCSAACTWGNFSTTCAAPVNANKVTASATVGQQVAFNSSLIATRIMKRPPTFSCGGAASLSTTVDHPYTDIQVNNPSTTATIKVSAWLTGTPEIDTVMAAYPTILPPTTDAELRACTFANDQCGGATVVPSCGTHWSVLTGPSAINIGPSSAVLIRVASYYAISDSFGTSARTGDFTLHVRTDP